MVRPQLRVDHSWLYFSSHGPQFSHQSPFLIILELSKAEMPGLNLPSLEAL